MSSKDHLSDLAWFRRSPGANLRIREPLNDREVIDLARQLDPNLVFLGTNDFPAPPGSNWQIAVIRVDARRHCRLLLLRSDSNPGDGDGFNLNLLCMGTRVALDHL